MSESLHELTWWMHDNTCIGMGAERLFDYSGEGTTFDERLGQCYRLAGMAFNGLAEVPASLPEPVQLIHGTRHGPGEALRIGHAWVVLSDGRVWEPITALLCDWALFNTYNRARGFYGYDPAVARRMMLHHQHYGPWT